MSIELNFASDNLAGASPEITQALTEAARSRALPYGNDDYSARLKAAFCDLFECNLEVFLTTSGTTANALALASIASNYGAIYCSDVSHINTDECGAPEFFTGGAKLFGLQSKKGKITPHALEQALRITPQGNPHRTQPAALSLTQSSELGTLYKLDELHELAEQTRKAGIPLHMDGARFANALVALGCSPAEMTWKTGVDVLSFGGTKNGCFAAEAILFFKKDLSTQSIFRQKRAGQLTSKMRFIAAQFLAYLENDLWLQNARHANALMQRLAPSFKKNPDCELVFPIEANMAFVRMPEDLHKRLARQRCGALFVSDPQIEAYRFVTAFDQSFEDVERAASILK